MKERPYPFGGAVFVPNATIVTDENSMVLSIHKVSEEKASYVTTHEEKDNDQTQSDR